MTQESITFSVFTKPWKMPLPELGRHISGLGFTGVELPVRPGFQVEPERVGRDLPRAAKQLGDFGLSITSVAAPTEEATIAACAEANVPLIRTMVPIADDGYLGTEARVRQQIEEWTPLLERYGVRVGFQNHCGGYVSTALGLRRLTEGFSPRHVGAVWDVAHNALSGEEPELAANILWSHLCLVNLKNAVWRRAPGPENSPAGWTPHWTGGREGLASWPRVATELKRRGYAGVVCLTAEYSDESSVDRRIADDLAFAQTLFAPIP